MISGCSDGAKVAGKDLFFYLGNCGGPESDRALQLFVVAGTLPKTRCQAIASRSIVLNTRQRSGFPRVEPLYHSKRQFPGQQPVGRVFSF